MTKPKRFSELTETEQKEILSDPNYKRYEDAIKKEDWAFVKIEKGSRAGTWATYF